MNKANITPLISIVIPIYKVESLLQRCVDSVIGQSYKNIEVILVDDGSPDRCGEMCDKYASQYENVKVLHQKNQGLSAARNAGVRMAKGEYIGFVDSDDYIDLDMYQNLWNAVSTFDASIAVCGIIDYYENTGEKRTYFDGKMHVMGQQQAIKCVLTNMGNVSPHSVTKLYKKDILEKHPFPIGKLYEDVYTIIKFFMETEKVAVVSKGLYYYCHRSDSIVESTFNKRDMDLKNAWDQNRNLIMEYFPDLKEEMEYRYFYGCFYLLDKIMNSKEKSKLEEKELVCVLRRNYRVVLKNKYFLKTRKLGMFVLKFSRWGYKFLSVMQTKLMNKNMKGSILR